MVFRQTVHLNWKTVSVIILFFYFRGVYQSNIENNTSSVDGNEMRNVDNRTSDLFEQEKCKSDQNCSLMTHPCISCDLNISCIYGKTVEVACEVKPHAKCYGNKKFNKEIICQYCYQTDPSEYKCELKSECKSVASPPEYYLTNCTVKNNITCLGKRTFNKRLLCNWTNGYKWITTLILSITLGGFGADRFYLGHWQEGIGKLFSFGGLGVWTLIDVLLISLHYLGPADGSLYI